MHKTGMGVRASIGDPFEQPGRRKTAAIIAPAAPLFADRS